MPRHIRVTDFKPRFEMRSTECPGGRIGRGEYRCGDDGRVVRALAGASDDLVAGPRSHLEIYDAKNGDAEYLNCHNRTGFLTPLDVLADEVAA